MADALCQLCGERAAVAEVGGRGSGTLLVCEVCAPAFAPPAVRPVEPPKLPRFVQPDEHPGAL